MMLPNHLSTNKHPVQWTFPKFAVSQDATEPAWIRPC